MPLRLKYLELNGYKTFATKTKFEFSGNITAVVGPNGSGKSNIADSLRWVLGEQSYKLLRGRKTDDMIFSGSQTKARASMASATVTFDNSDGWLPIDFSEVSITRRAYRDGQNEYLINNQRVRLQDVSEMLSKSGLSERTYTVIGQGLVDTALTLKSEERRRLFEEAAGVGLYRKRKELAIRRLDNTRRNLERVQDILAELSPRLRSLERQAKRAQEYEQVRVDLQEILREWYGFHWHRTQEELLHAREVASNQEIILEHAREVQAKADLELSGLRDQINGMRARLSSWHRELAQTHLQRETTTRDLAVSGERQRSMLQEQSRIEREIAILQEEVAAQQARLDSAKEVAESHRAEIAEAESQADEARNNMLVREERRRALQAEVGDLNETVAILKTSKVEFQAKKTQIEERLASSKERETNIEVEIEKAKIELSEISDKLTAAIDVQTKAEESLKQAEDRLQAHKDKIESLYAKIKDMEANIARQEAAKARIAAQFEVLAQAEREFTGYASGAKILLEASNQGRMKGSKGALSHYLKVDSRYEVAISAVLDDFINAVLVRGSDDMEEALSALEVEPGKAVVLPLSGVVPGEALKSKGDQGVLGIAANLVEVPPEIRPVIDLLLGRVIVVEQRSAAKKALAGQPKDVRVVTLRGEVFHNDGPVIVNAEGGGGALQRRREMQELGAQIEQLDGELAVKHKDLNKAVLEAAALDQALPEYRTALENAKTALKTAQEQHQASTLAVEQARNQVEWHSSQVVTLKEEIEQAVRFIEQLGLDQNENQARLAEAENGLRAAQAQLNGLPLEELQTQVSHWDMQLAVSRQAYQAAERAQLEQQTAYDKANHQLAELEQQRTKITSSFEHIKSSMTEMRDSEGGIGEKIQSLQTLIEPTEKELHHAELMLAEVQEKETEARKSLNIAERHNAQAQIALNRHQESFESLREKIEDDFGLVAFDYAEEVSGPTPLPLGEMVERLPVVTELSPDIEDMLKRYRVQLRRMGAINPEAQREYVEVQERHQFLIAQMADLEEAEEDIREVIVELDVLMERDFRTTFERVASEFREIFARLFPGGSARLMLTDEEHLIDSGVDIEARLPGKRMQRLALLSGGERSMTAVALVFALLKASPTPFCVMDEVDAALDEANVERLREILSELSAETQFVLITHNRNTVQAADLIYGITMGRDTTSQSISLRLEDVDERYSS